ncbi:hypothetical protein EDC01DRAFT_716401 [Geopyxis carbonaria]|nr:hypothetical protein EDC01DRAFT_716401 [Geopyxis carbonaria]
MASSMLRKSKKDDQISQDASLLRLAAVAESRADSLVATGNIAGALDAAIKAAELYLKARSQCTNEVEHAALERKCQELLAKAERWKRQKKAEDAADQQDTTPKYASGPPKRYPAPKFTKKLSVKEEMILLKSSKINGNVFPPWKGPPASTEFPEEPFLLPDALPSDPAGFLKLSETQTAILDDWKRPGEIYGEAARISGSKGDQSDLTQDVITDCSVVASLCAGTRREARGLGPTVTNIIYPQNNKDEIVESPSGKYIVKLFFNGCYRKVIIDDFLPKASTERILYVSCRNNPEIFAYALIEKAYLKVMGGYDFPGSNSGTDLLVLTGWIPEHLFLQSDEFVFSALWRRMRKAWNSGDLLITLGTGRMTILEEKEFGLIGEHDYAVLDMKEENGDKMMLVKNPWSEGTVWRDMTLENSDDERDFDAPSDDEDKKEPPPQSSLEPGVFWISFENVCRNFASIYLNWNPLLFTHIHETHFSWDLATHVPKTSFGRNPQFSVSNPSSSSTTVWIMLSRHMGLPETIGEGMIRNGFIALYLFDSAGDRVYLDSPWLYRTPYVDSPQTLLRVDNIPPKTTYTLVVSSQQLSKVVHNFSLFAYSLSTVTVDTVKEPYPYSATLSSSWTTSTSGGNANSPSYPTNPQFRLSLPTTSALTTLLLESPSPHPLHIQLVHSSGKRVATVTTKDIITESGEYKRSTALATTRSLDPGVYTAITSTFEPGQLGDFKLTLLTTSPDASFSALPSETAGCFETIRSGTWAAGARRVSLPIEAGRLMKVWVKACSSGSQLRVSIERKFASENDKVVVRSGGGFRDLPMGVRTEPVDLVAGNGGYLVVLERFGDGETEWEVTVVSEGNVWVGEEEEEEEVDDDDDDEEDE